MKCRILFSVKYKKKIFYKVFCLYINIPVLTFTTLWVDSVDDKLMIFFLFFPENRILHFS